MKKNNNMICRIITTLLSLTLLFSMSINVSAETNSFAELSYAYEDAIQPRGSLSGYGHQYTSGSLSGQFDFYVSGSWSPIAGCTVLFDGFPSGTNITYKLVEVSSGRQMFGNSPRTFTVTSNDNDDNNIPLLNVSPGTYRLIWTVPSAQTGTIHCYIY